MTIKPINEDKGEIELKFVYFSYSDDLSTSKNEKFSKIFIVEKDQCIKLGIN